MLSIQSWTFRSQDQDRPRRVLQRGVDRRQPEETWKSFHHSRRLPGLLRMHNISGISSYRATKQHRVDEVTHFSIHLRTPLVIWIIQKWGIIMCECEGYSDPMNRIFFEQFFVGSFSPSLFCLLNTLFRQYLCTSFLSFPFFYLDHLIRLNVVKLLVYLLIKVCH